SNARDWYRRLRQFQLPARNVWTFAIIRASGGQGNGSVDRGALDQIRKLDLFANDSKIAKVRHRARQDIGIQFELLRTGLRDLNWLTEFPRRNVYLCTGGKTLRQTCRRIVSRIQRRRAQSSFCGSSAAQLIPKLTEIIARRIALAVCGKQIVGTGCRREKEEASHPPLGAKLGNKKRRAVAGSQPQ